MKLRLALATLLAVAAIRAADTPPVFNATLTMGKEHRFVLVDAEGKASSFLKLGDTFAGYKLTAYDPKDAALELERDGKISRVTLVSDAAIQNAPAAPTRATLADAEEVFRVMRFDDMMKKILDGQKKGMLPMMQQSIAQAVGRMGANLSEDDKAALTALQTKMLDQMLGAITSPEMRTAMAKIYSEVFSKEELSNLSAFYSTTTGQALVEKQPDVQQKMMSVMMPMMMKNQQTAQREMGEFMSGLKAKYGAGGAPGGAPAPSPGPKP